MRKYILLVVVLMAFPLSVCKAEEKSVSELSEMQILEQKCDTLSSETGRDYQVVSGKFLASKYSIYQAGHGDEVIIFNMPLNTKEGYVEGDLTVSYDQVDIFYEKLHGVIGKEVFEQNIDNDDQYAFCGTKIPLIKQKPVFDGKLDTLIKLEERRNLTNNNSLEHECAQLSEQTKNDYKVISGQVFKAYAISTMGGHDCFDCPPESFMAMFRAIMSPLGIKDEKQHFFVLTPKENEYQLSQKEPYMHIGKAYEFCARGPEMRGASENRKTYFIDNLDTIREIDNKGD